MSKRNTAFYLIAILVLLMGVFFWYGASVLHEKASTPDFDGQRALADVATQLSFGPRIPGSQGHTRVQVWIRAELEAAGWAVEIQSTQQAGHPVENIIARRSSESPEIIIGAHYDSRIFADRDPDPSKQDQPVPGADDGASGVAVLLGLARSFPRDTVPLWLVFFDSEDNGQIGDWDWILGSRAFVAQNPVTPSAVVVVDMVGDADLNLYLEKNSNQALSAEIWDVAAELGYGDLFIPRSKHSMIDDHTPFIEAGIRAVDIIDFDYPYYHTTEDTLDKISAQSLEAVGRTVQTWVLRQDRQRK